MYHMRGQPASNILLIGLLAFAGNLLPLPARAAELLMFESGGCIYCQRWDRAVGSIYDKTPEAKILPLLRHRCRSAIRQRRRAAIAGALHADIRGGGQGP